MRPEPHCLHLPHATQYFALRRRSQPVRLRVGDAQIHRAAANRRARHVPRLFRLHTRQGGQYCHAACLYTSWTPTAIASMSTYDRSQHCLALHGKQATVRPICRASLCSTTHRGVAQGHRSAPTTRRRSSPGVRDTSQAPLSLRDRSEKRIGSLRGRSRPNSARAS